MKQSLTLAFRFLFGEGVCSVAWLDMGKASYELTIDKVKEVVTSKSAGNYALGHNNSEGKFVPKYVGRADADVKERLTKHVGGKYKRFKFSYASSPKSAFEKECKNWHDFQDTLDNLIHPDRPDGTNWKCPVSDCDHLT